MSETLIDIATEVASELTAKAFSQPVNAVRMSLPFFDREELNELHVSVVTKGVEEEAISRGDDTQCDYQVDVAIQQAVDGPDDPRVDELMALRSEIVQACRRLELKGMPNARWAKTENKPVYDPEHMNEKNVFTSLITLTFKTLE